jgi:hypothetical protein
MTTPLLGNASTPWMRDRRCTPQLIVTSAQMLDSGGRFHKNKM